MCITGNYTANPFHERLIATESFQSKVDGKRTRKMAFLEISIRQACLVHRQIHLVVGVLLDPRRLVSLPYSVKALIQSVINLKLSMQSFRKKRHQTPYSVALFH